MKIYRTWTYETIVAEILVCARNSDDLSYTNMRKQYTALTRAAERFFGNWRKAVEAAGLDYEAIRRYKIWNRERIIQQIQYWHAQGADLCWHNVSMKLDPALAAAVQHGRYVTGWAEALRQAGLEPQAIYRYKKWTLEQVKEEILSLQQLGTKLDQDTLMIVYPALLAAVYRIGGGLVKVRALLEDQQEAPADEALLQDMDESLLIEVTQILRKVEQPTHSFVPAFSGNDQTLARIEAQ
ncbi:MAG: hypothetical protein ACYC7E_16250 [Armatimonadota bacterium]